jgi:hypothetical protein
MAVLSAPRAIRGSQSESWAAGQNAAAACRFELLPFNVEERDQVIEVR